MRLDPTRLLGPLAALLVLVLVVQQTMGALQAAGVWRRSPPTAPRANPYAHIEDLLASGGAPAAASTRDPFVFGRAPAPPPARRPAAPRPAVAPVVPERPRLTSIVWLEGNPSATIRWKDRDYPVQVNTLFDEFRVRRITRDRVILEREGETLVLQLPKKGD